MNLYVNDKDTNERINIDLRASSREDLIYRIGSRSFTVRGKRYDVNDVYAYNGDSDTIGGVLIGALVGFLAGPGAVLVTGTAGGLIGGIRDQKGKAKAKEFNESLA